MTHREPPDAPTPKNDRLKLRALDEADRMWAALEGDLDAQELERFEQRVASDEALRGRVREARALDALLPFYVAPQPSVDLIDRTLERVANDGDLRAAWYRRRVSLPLPAAAALLLGVGLCLAWFLLREKQPLASGDAPATRQDVAQGLGGEHTIRPEHLRDPSTAMPDADRALRRSFGPRIVIGAAGSAAGFFDIDAEDELFPLDAPAEEAEAEGAPETPTAPALADPDHREPRR